MVVQVTPGDRIDDMGDREQRVRQIRDRLVKGPDGLDPSACSAVDERALIQFAFLADCAPEARELVGGRLLELDDVIECVGDAHGEARAILSHAHAKVTALDLLKHAQQLITIQTVWHGWREIRSGRVGVFFSGHERIPSTDMEWALFSSFRWRGGAAH